MVYDFHGTRAVGMNDDELAFLCDRFDEERMDRLEQQLGGAREWDDADEST